jgi:hypothetical protein
MPGDLAPTKIALVGNSYAVQWRQSLASVLPKGSSLVPFTLAACDPAATESDAKQIDGVSCFGHRKWSVAQVQKLRPDVTIVSTTGSSKPSAMAKLIKELRTAGPVLWIGFPPNTPSFQTCLGQDHRIRACQLPLPEQFSTNNANVGIAAASKTTYLNLKPLLCTSMTCPAFIKGHEVRFDGSHLTSWALDALSPALRQAIIQTLQSAK